MSYQADYGQATNDNVYVQRVQMAMLSAAVDIATEAAGTTNHANRVALVKAAANAPAGYAHLFAYLAAVDASTTVASTDAEIKARVSAIWNVVAGVP